MYEKDYWN